MSERIIIGTKLQAKNQPTLGLIAAIAEEVDGGLYSITDEGFCPTRQVFVVGRYEEIEARFRPGELFRIRVELSQTQPGQEKFGLQCKYKALGNAAEKLQPNEIVEILEAELPDRNFRRLAVNSLPGTKYVLLKSGSGNFYGPFEWEDKSQPEETTEIELKIITGGGLGKAGRLRQIRQISASTMARHIVDLTSIAGRKILVQNVASIAESGFEEYASDKEIIDYVKTVAGDAAGRIIDRKSLATLSSMASLSKQGSEQLVRNRIAIFNKILASNADLLGDMNELCSSYLKNEAGAKFLEEYVQINRAKYIDQLKREKDFEVHEKIKRSQDEFNQIQIAIERARKEETSLNDKITAKRESLERDVLADQQAYVDKVSKDFQEKIALLKSEEEEANKRITKIRASLAAYEEVDGVESLVTERRGVLRQLNFDIDNSKKELSALREESRKEEDDIRKKLRGMKPYVDHLNGAYTGENPKVRNIDVVCADITNKDEIHGQRSVIESVRTRLAGLGRSLSEQQVANLLISTQQSFITLFAGLPGVGKTSLCKLMAQVQGVEKRLLSVSVARGWTSIRDLVGFLNPLNDRFQPSATGMYEFLQALNKEAGSSAINPMAYILLDEANLSSIEHYWSAFMAISDATSEQMLAIGSGQITLPRNLRFLATINYDGTTEPLSPRILNRASVIVMNPDQIASRQQYDEELLQELPIPSRLMDSLFGLFEEAPLLEIEEESAIDSIREVLADASIDKGRSIYISQRKMNAIRHYCGRARTIMRSGGSEVAALDWATMQHILPQVSGHGSKFGARLIALRKCLEDNGLEMSAEYLDRMIANGQSDLHSYEFFCW